MSSVHKVIILNKPLKIGIFSIEFTPVQWLLMLTATILAFVIGSNIPMNVKINGMPLGFLAGFLLFCGALVFVSMSEVKPWCWWKNMVVYRLRMVPTMFLPKPEEAPIYPDPTIIEVKKRSEEFYVDAG